MNPEIREPGNQEVTIGWVCQPSRREDSELLGEAVEAAAERLRSQLAEQFAAFHWRTEIRRRRTIAPGHRGIDPIDLVETGCGEKIARGWDFAFVVTDAELLARERPFTIGIPSSALETAVITTARFPTGPDEPDLRLAVMAQYLFGHLLGLEPHEPGAMRRPTSEGSAQLEPFDEADQGLLQKRLAAVADLRLEERRAPLNRLHFAASAFLTDPKRIWADVVGYQPWLQPFRLGRLTAAAFITTLLLFLGAEAWELGVGMGLPISTAAALTSIVCSALFLYRGQNLTELSRRRVLSEQLARSHVVLLLCLVIGMAALWTLLCVASIAIAWLLPWPVIERWLDAPFDLADALRFSTFTATIGTLAGALGGNLEDEDDFKAQFLFDEEV